jgi:hypothetical protein
MARYSIPKIVMFFGLGVGSMSFISCKVQGIEGHVLLVSGNQMPSPDRPPSAGKGIKTTLYIYPLTNLSQVERLEHSTFYSRINTTLVKKIETKDNGYFKVRLSPGQYSLFLMKDTLFYANRFDDKNNIAPVAVVANKTTKIEVKMDYDAVY